MCSTITLGTKEQASSEELAATKDVVKKIRNVKQDTPS